MKRLLLPALLSLSLVIGCKGSKGPKGDNGSPNQVQTFTGTVGEGLSVGGGFEIFLPSLPANSAILAYVSGDGTNWQLLPAMDTGGSAFAVVTFFPATVTFYNTNSTWIYRIMVIQPPSGSGFQRVVG